MQVRPKTNRLGCNSLSGMCILGLNTTALQSSLQLLLRSHGPWYILGASTAKDPSKDRPIRLFPESNLISGRSRLVSMAFDVVPFLFRKTPSNALADDRHLHNAAALRPFFPAPSLPLSRCA